MSIPFHIDCFREVVILPCLSDCMILMQDLYDSLVGYLQERGIDQRFAVEVVQFYRVHEHRCYVEHGLKALRNFLKDH